MEFGQKQVFFSTKVGNFQRKVRYFFPYLVGVFLALPAYIAKRMGNALRFLPTDGVMLPMKPNRRKLNCRKG